MAWIASFRALPFMATYGKRGSSSCTRSRTPPSTRAPRIQEMIVEMRAPRLRPPLPSCSVATDPDSWLKRCVHSKVQPQGRRTSTQFRP